MAREGKAWRRKFVWECERGTAGLLLSGLKSLGAPASKQSPLCFQEDRLKVDMTVPLAFPVSGVFGERSAYQSVILPEITQKPAAATFETEEAGRDLHRVC